MYSMLPAFNLIGRFQFIQIFKPKAYRFCFTMPELMRLYYLIVFFTDDFNRVFMGYRIFNSLFLDRCFHNELEKLGGFLHFTPKVSFCEPTNTRIT